MKQCMHNWLTRTCVASIWPPKVPLDALKLPPWVLWEEQVEEVEEVEVEEVLREAQWEAEVQTRG